MLRDDPFLAVPVGPVSLFDAHERIIFKFLDGNILELLRIGVILTGIHEAGDIRSLGILDDDMVLRRRRDVVFDFFIDDRIVGIIGLRHDVFIEGRRPMEMKKAATKIGMARRMKFWPPAA